MVWFRVATTARPLSVAAVFGLFASKTNSDGERKNVKSIAEPVIRVEKPSSPVNEILLSRRIINESDPSGLKLTLFQYETCPFCCKVRAFLDYYGLSYDVVEVNPVTRSQTKFAGGYKKVPIVRCGEHTLVESSLIVSQLMTFLLRGKDRSLESIAAMYPVVESVDEKGKQVKLYPNKYFVMREKVGTDTEMANQREEREWREWVDGHFIHLISPNVYRTMEESMETFRWFEQVGEWERTFPTWERMAAVYLGAVAMFLISKRLKTRHSIEDERKALKDACELWMNALGENRKFMGGETPNLADIELFGAMNSFYGCRAFKEVICDGPIKEWYLRMKERVSGHEGSKLLLRSNRTPTSL